MITISVQSTIIKTITVQAGSSNKLREQMPLYIKQINHRASSEFSIFVHSLDIKLILNEPLFWLSF